MKLFLSAITALMLAFSVGAQQVKPKGEVKAKENATVQSQIHTDDQKNKEKREDATVSTDATETNRAKVESQTSIQDLLHLPKVETEETSSLKLFGDVNVKQEND